MKYDLPDRVRDDICRFAEKNGIEKVILFGSRAKGTNSERSDIDLAVQGGDSAAFYFDLEDYAYTLLMFDVVDINKTKNEELLREIERDGIVIYEKVR
ncbi:MAG: nucleotidyltransferase domain-containing protein [Clostridiales bacterium]|nr:nucleotidyltransferase domain-containing protein [Clostridiales bacterium]MCD7828081.1 nucleotidyltransferase domain-containing protein [Clostridiales bacterium]